MNGTSFKSQLLFINKFLDEEKSKGLKPPLTLNFHDTHSRVEVKKKKESWEDDVTKSVSSVNPQRNDKRCLFEINHNLRFPNEMDKDLWVIYVDCWDQTILLVQSLFRGLLTTHPTKNKLS